MSVTLTAKAADKVRAMMSQPDQKGATGLRIAVVGGGCSGMTYKLELESVVDEKDQVIESEGVNVYVDPKSALFVGGIEVDYFESMMGSGFQFSNPNATGTCGCGTSFTT